MATTNITFRTDLQDKQEFEKVINSLGLNLSTAFNVFIKAVIRENAIPFELRGASHFPNTETQKAIKEVEEKIDLQPLSIKELKSLKQNA
ncbi:type II toxin-antitoxin system RelB/DinJ family antitoxin [Helicobacter brantae]|uniref:Type II toxin-antitoxin system antitoxin, RelB/DinJ family n=1 Tax=Helicobacter brantae TaxID=375927 RepID=A0A3D8J3X7_9HELI|nr:type II toxin-antitoxin system RelB/DinJ family antitoxin [Helicobacter brantae]RDU72178.1 type II toxin-antitoxin system antitoxin, RelB/DinJ family [Helicobacter brantae]